MEKQSNLSAGEWKLMKQLWARGPATVKELTDALREETNWTRNTIITMLTRLKAKGVVGCQLGGPARRYYPQAKIVCRWAAQDCMTLDGMPYIGPYSGGTAGLFTATGFNKWGMTGAMAAAALLTDLVQGRESRYEVLFDPQRTILRPQLAVNMLGAVVNLLTPTAPRCPHMGCALKYNRQEHSWDCPCHGSRFAEDGRVLDGPANGDKKM